QDALRGDASPKGPSGPGLGDPLAAGTCQRAVIGEAFPQAVGRQRPRRALPGRCTGGLLHQKRLSSEMPGAEPTLPPFEVRAVLVGEHEYRLVGPLEQSTVAGPKIGGPGGPGGPGGAAGSAVDGDHVDDRTARAFTYQQRILGPRTR